MAARKRIRRLRRENVKLRRELRRGDFFTRPLTPKTYRQELRSATNLRFGPEREELLGQARASDYRSSAEIPAWYAQYRQQLRDVQGRTGRGYSEAQAAVAAQGQAAGAQDEAARQRIRQENEASAKLRGTTYAPEADTRAADAAGARGTSQGAFHASLARQGADQGAYLLDRERIVGGDELQRRFQELNRRRSADRALAELSRRVGAFRDEFRRDTRGAERKYALERTAFGDKNAYYDFATKQQRRGIGAKRKAAGRAHRRAVQQENLQFGHSQALIDRGRGGGEKKGGYNLHDAMAFLRAKGGKRHPRYKQKMIDYLHNRGVPLPVARRAANRYIQPPKIKPKGKSYGGGALNVRGVK